jgi:hypothetical protein
VQQCYKDWHSRPSFQIMTTSLALARNGLLTVGVTTRSSVLQSRACLQAFFTAMMSKMDFRYT